MKKQQTIILASVLCLLFLGCEAMATLFHGPKPEDPPAPPTPEITVKQGDTVIVQNGEYDFGTIFLNTTKELTFAIENSGEADLTLDTVNGNRINLTDNTTGYFSVNLQPLSSTVTPGNATTFTIRFTPTMVRNDCTAAVQIKSNSQNNGEFAFRVKGNSIDVSYQIGDTGPGGGMIFFAEGGQYKECSGELGTNNWNGAMTAATGYRGGGFSDWRLPDRGELDAMYRNLHLNGLGQFVNDRYWSSTPGSLQNSTSNANNAYVQNFGSTTLTNYWWSQSDSANVLVSIPAGAQGEASRTGNTSIRVRAVRSFQ